MTIREADWRLSRDLSQPIAGALNEFDKIVTDLQKCAVYPGHWSPQRLQVPSGRMLPAPGLWPGSDGAICVEQNETIFLKNN